MADADVAAPRTVDGSRLVLSPAPPKEEEVRRQLPSGYLDDLPRSSFQETLQQIARDAATPHQHQQQQRQQESAQAKRFFAWLPKHGMVSDLVYGSWWFIYGSIFSAVIPLVPLVSLYIRWWPDPSTFLPLDIHVAAYALLFLTGVFFTVGSYAFLRAVHPKLKDTPLFNKASEKRREHLGLLQRQCMTDELFGMWCFFWGMATAIPIMCFYVWYTKDSGETYFKGALLLVIFFTIITGTAVWITYPKESSGGHQQQLSRLLQRCCPCRAMQPHLQNDMLILSWLMLLGCIFSTVVCAGLLVHAAHSGNGRELFDYSTGLADMIVFDVGCVYFTAGWYVDAPENDATPLSPPGSPSSSDQIELGGVGAGGTGLSVYGPPQARAVA